ncbi:MAG TPA: BMP family ABC transporter substrate-binding protein [Anaerolineae bacterium]|nr:BMP family ABC transporter substrate-binding protein [Anaerolineae bacterium]
MQRSVLAIIAFTFVGLLSACQAAATEADCSRLEVLCVGLVTDAGGVDDRSFNQSAWEGVKTAEQNFPGAIVNSIETEDATDYGNNIALFADKGYDVIVTVGFAYGQVTIEAAQKYPNVKFIGIDQFQAPGQELPNLSGVIFPEDQAGFLAGALAAQVSQSGKIAAVFGADLVPQVVAFKEGYEAGAKYIRPDIEVISTFHPGGFEAAFTDPEWGAATARQALDQGADVVFAAAGRTGNGALIETAGQAGAFCIGVDTDQWETLPEARPCLVSSAIKLIAPSIEALIRQAQAGAFSGGNTFGAVGLAPFHDFESKLNADIKTQLAEVDRGLKEGTISIKE